MQIPDDLHPACLPVAWLLGTWEGAGVGRYPGAEATRVGQEAVFSYVPGQPYLVYSSAMWALSEAGQISDTLSRESGFWRVQPDAAIEVVLALASGVVEIYLGTISPAKVEMAARGVLATETAGQHRASSRLYGLVNDRLMWVMDMPAPDDEPATQVSAELIRVADPAPA
jgi:hypothetical protein